MQLIRRVWLRPTHILIFVFLVFLKWSEAIPHAQGLNVIKVGSRHGWVGKQGGQDEEFRRQLLRSIKDPHVQELLLDLRLRKLIGQGGGKELRNLLLQHRGNGRNNLLGNRSTRGTLNGDSRHMPGGKGPALPLLQLLVDKGRFLGLGTRILVNKGRIAGHVFQNAFKTFGELADQYLGTGDDDIGDNTLHNLIAQLQSRPTPLINVIDISHDQEKHGYSKGWSPDTDYDSQLSLPILYEHPHNLEFHPNQRHAEIGNKHFSKPTAKDSDQWYDHRKQLKKSHKSEESNMQESNTETKIIPTFKPMPDEEIMVPL